MDFVPAKGFPDSPFQAVSLNRIAVLSGNSHADTAMAQMIPAIDETQIPCR